MAIKNEDLIIYKPERVTQFPNGGGKISGLVLQSGKSNEIFADVTPVARVTGQLAYGKIFPSAKTYGDPMTDNEGNVINGVDGKPIIVPETLQAAGVIITKNPDDTNIGALIFATDNHYDEVKDIKNKIESYSVKTVRISGELVGLQPKGSKMIGLAQQITAKAPNSGDTICIIQDEGKVTQIEQYVKVQKVEVNQQDVMIKSGNDFRSMQLNMVNLQLYYPLEYDFDGGELTGTDNANKRAFLRASQTSDATSYKGASELVENTNIGDLRVKVKSVYGQLAPPSEGQENIVDMTAGTDATPLIASGGSTLFTTQQNMGQGSMLFCGAGILPGTLKINYSGGSLHDVGGQLMAGETPVGIINYASGLINFSLSSPMFNGEKTVVFSVATMPTGKLSETEQIIIGESNRGDSYNINLFPIPEPGSTMVDYIAMGRRYRLKDRGDGVIESDGAGVGRVDFRTGSVSVTLAAIPDANSSIIFSYGNKIDYMNRAKDIQDGTINQESLGLSIKQNLKTGHILRGSVVVKWQEGEDKKSVKDDGQGNFKSDDLTGTINYVTGEIELKPTKTIAKGAIFTVDYSKAGEDNTRSENLSGYSVSQSVQQVQLEQNIRQKSVRIQFNIQAQTEIDTYTTELYRTDIVAYDKDGDGILYNSSNGDKAGEVDYVTGLAKININQRAIFWVPHYATRPRPTQNGGSYQAKWGISYYEYRELWGRPPMDGTQYIDINYAISGSDSEQSEEIKVDNYILKLTPTIQEYIVPNSVRFTFTGRKYYDVDGSIYADMDPITGSGSFAGLINYQNGEVTLLNWNNGASNRVTVSSLLTMLNYLPISGMEWIIPAAPIRPGSLMIRATRIDGVRLEAIVGENGEVKAASMEARTDNRTGITSVNFGAWVNVEGNEEEEWFDPQNIVNGKIWQPYLVMIDTIKYNVVATSFSPIAPEILGISLVRIPTDGRVPVLRLGDLVVLHETIDQVFPLDVPNDHVVSFSVQLVTDLYVKDQDGKTVDCKKFEFNKINGEIKIIDNDFSGYKQPLIGYALIEEENVVTDVQINGHVALRKPIRHKFTKNALLSGVVFLGDMQARYNTLFEQSVWKTDEWSDIPSGRPNWRYNDTDYPIKVTNADTAQERWALLFDNPTTFKIYGENLGYVGVGSIGSDCKPINPNTSAPYFELLAAGWGKGGMSPGNVLRFNTIAANKPIWMTRSVIPSDDTGAGDSFEFRFRGFKTGDNK
ncbi:MAG: hypothetical protein ACRCXK_02010 [Wohlfahrtiimonas sp.]